MDRSIQKKLILIAIFFSAWNLHANQPSMISSAQSEPLVRIGVRKSEIKSEFYSKATGKKFVPQGVNWVHLSEVGNNKAENISFDSAFFRKHRDEIAQSLQKISA